MMSVMRKAFYISALICASLLAGCRKENFGTAVEPGLPASLDVVVNLGSGSNVAMTRGIYDYESEISELMLIMFSAEGRKMVIDLTGNLKAGPAGGTYGAPRTYTLAAPVTADCYGKRILSGTYEVYAIANWSSPFCGLTKDDLLKLDKEGLAAAVASNSGLATGVTGSQKFPMTGYAKEQIVYPDSETSANATKIKVSLKRLISHIEMNFVNGTGSENPNFIPHSYSIYNLPGSSWLMSRGDNEGDNLKSDCAYGNKENIEVTGSGVIEFFMLENVKEKADASSCATYNDRDKWSGGSSAAETAPGNKTWTYAPEGSTFIVVSGEYTGKSYIGNVSYTIHLGNFSGTNLTASKSGFDNFTVNRNEYQKYTITVKGVNNIVGEVTVGETTGVERQPGAEGVLTDMTKSSNFVLDGHYENVILAFALPKGTSPQIIVKTPYNQMKPYSLKDADLTGVDYKWVKFGKPAGTATLAAYPGADKVLDIKGLSDALHDCGGASTDYFIVENGTVYVQAYVDEYFYDTNPVTGASASWPEFVNQENRVLIFNPSSATSADGNTTLYPDYSFQISQRSIRTTYNTDDSSIEAFGIETWNETGRTAFGTAKPTDSLDNSFGWKNNKILLSGSYGNANAGTWPAAAKTLGYTTSVTSNDKSAHVYYTEGVGTASLNGYNACMARNRDENGDGVIDDTELKWYLPAINQYLLLWCGEEYLYGDTRLVDPADISKITETDYNAGVYNLYNSSYAHEYWAVEGVSYGPAGPQSCGVRCIRNLKTYNAKTQPISSVSGNTITITGVRSLRQQAMSGEYASHNDRDPENNLYKAFEVATSYLPGPYSASQVKTESLCASYSQDSNGSDVGQWRIPNQKELMIMGQNGFLDDIKPSTGNSTEGYASRTEFIRADLRSRTNPYFYMYWNGPTITVSTNDVNVFRIRCVRDVTQ